MFSSGCILDDPSEQIELRLDQFTFRFPKSLRYSEAGLWMRLERILRISLGIGTKTGQDSPDLR